MFKFDGVAGHSATYAEEMQAMLALIRDLKKAGKDAFINLTTGLRDCSRVLRQKEYLVDHGSQRVCLCLASVLCQVLGRRLFGYCSATASGAE